MRIPARALFSLLLLLLVAAPAAAERHALLIGVSGYKDLPALAGPKSDILLMRKLLEQQGIKSGNVRVLADEVPAGVAAGLPTKAAIMAEIDKLSASLPANSELLIYYSGHGSQVPANHGNEQDGADEVLLPLDIGRWSVVEKTVANAITDDEIGAAVERLTRKGVFVWLIVDACHSGTVSRGARGIARQASPAQLGIPAAAFAASGATRGGARGGDDAFSVAGGRGGFVGFYAAQAEQLALEFLLPQDAPEGVAEPHGLLTFHLARALRQKAAGSYAELALQIQAGFASTVGSLPPGAKEMPTPLFEGDLHRRPFIGSGDPAKRLYPMRVGAAGLTIAAGLLDDIQRGARFIISRPDNPAPLAIARVTDVSAESSEAVVEDGSGTSLAGLRALAQPGVCPDGCVLQAQLKSRPTNFALTIAVDTGQASPAGRTGLETALAALSALPPDRRPVAFERARLPAQADIELRVIGERLWLLPPGSPVPTSEIARIPSLGAENLTSDQLGLALRAVARSRNLSRVAATIASTPAARALSVRALVERVPSPNGKCAFPLTYTKSIPAAARPVDTGVAGEKALGLENCDLLYLEIKNRGTETIDVTPLYLGADYSVTYVGPREALSIASGASEVVVTGISTDNGQFAGLEQIVLLAVARPSRVAMAADLRRLSAPGLAALQPRPSATSLRSGDPLAALYDEADDGSGEVRSGQVPIGDGRSGAIRILLKTVPQ